MKKKHQNALPSLKNVIKFSYDSEQLQQDCVKKKLKRFNEKDWVETKRNLGI